MENSRKLTFDIFSIIFSLHLYQSCFELFCSYFFRMGVSEWFFSGFSSWRQWWMPFFIRYTIFFKYFQILKSRKSSKHKFNLTKYSSSFKSSNRIQDKSNNIFPSLWFTFINNEMNKKRKKIMILFLRTSEKLSWL